MTMTPRPGRSEALRAHSCHLGQPSLDLRQEPSRARALSPLSLPRRDGEHAILDAPPGKKPLLRLSAQPLNCEAPVTYLGTAITPNDAFFVRCNLPEIPRIDPDAWRLVIGGDGANKRSELGLDDLKRLPSVELVAVCQCSGNRRSLFTPQTPGIQWGNGAVGCARWKGARLKDVLAVAGLTSNATEIVFDGADNDGCGKTPDFSKSIPVWKAIEETTLVAYEMNGKALPHLNGFPARIIVPGWTATYWVKHVTSITAVSKPFNGYWMKSTYRVPFGKFPTTLRFVSQESATDAPITEMMVNSLITSPEDCATVDPRSKVAVAGVAWDGGHGIRSVEVSSDGGQTWAAVTLGKDLGPFAFRSWRHRVSLDGRGPHVVMARAINTIGQTQPAEPIANPGGYHHNAVHALTLLTA